ncbi:hypothetical protein [Aequorivita marisscotiae]|uniref:Response regulator n=1 Tax=Aequorivita marisscotiae TaxID=3040348 RepID=A0ABY8KTY5_9FLAO|nr:hypothetical protein [Aequorivita sp. Ant34-E75]WGF91535.1 hypothetical protein QCQ61_09980 [Aequorivita sp. Ant34-E75]
MAYNLIYVDDEVNKRDTFADSLSDKTKLLIKTWSPSKIEKTRDDLISKKNTIDGIILDLKLDGIKNEEDTANYTAPSLAQAIRSKFAEEGFKYEIPIFLLTSQDNLEKLYKYDLTSHDLFDFLFFKQKLGEVNNYTNKIVSIITAYKTIASVNKNLDKILKINIDELGIIVFSSKYYSPEATIYDISKFILRKIILLEGVLISENLLAARLGIDTEASGKGWLQLKEKLTPMKYEGIYSDCWERWWNHKLINIWREFFPHSQPLIRLNADERVALLSEKFKLKNLIAAKPISKAKGNRFWTVCKVYKKPLDIRDGIMIESLQEESWHDKSYISLESVLERDYTDKNFIIHPTEINRVKELKKLIN